MPKKLSLDDFIEKANKIHKSKYDYSLVDYINNITKIKIICPEHGIFEQRPQFHLNGSDCPECGKINRIKNRWLPYSKFIEQANLIHNYYYEYIKESYHGSNNKIKIVCPIHGEFEQIVFAHLKGQKCSKCKKNYSYTTEEFITKAKEIHKNKYDYSLVDYKKSHDKVKIICPIHGEFKQIASQHLRGHGCPDCITFYNVSKGEKEVLDYIKSIYKDKIIENSRKIIRPYELDIYLPDIKLAVEYNGEYWHKLYEEKLPGYHKLKEKLCQENDITLISIWENDWQNTRNEIIDLINYNIHHKCHLVY